MARSLSLGLFGVFGRSAELRHMDRALRSVDLHPNLVPEAVKLAAVKLLQEHAIGDEPAPQSYGVVAEIIAYCMIGANAFAGANEPGLAEPGLKSTETRTLLLPYWHPMEAGLTALSPHPTRR